MMCIQHSLSSKLWRTASNGSAVVAICRRAMILSGQIRRGSRLFQVLTVEDYLDEDRGPLVEQARGSWGIEKLLKTARHIARMFIDLTRRDIQAFKSSRLNALLSGMDGYVSRLPATLFLILFIILFFLIYFWISAVCPDAYWMVPWSAGPVIGVLAALLIARSGGNGQGRGLLGKAALSAAWLFRGASLLLRRIRRGLSNVLHGRGKTPVEGGPEI